MKPGVGVQERHDMIYQSLYCACILQAEEPVLPGQQGGHDGDQLEHGDQGRGQLQHEARDQLDILTIIDCTHYGQQVILFLTFIQFCVLLELPHSAPSWILS